MIHDASTPEEYRQVLDDDWRKEKLLQVRQMMLDAGATEAMGYGMLRYTIDDGILAHLNAQKGYVAVYLGELERIDPGAKIRGKADCGKTCLRLKKRSDPAMVESLIRQKIKLGLPKLDAD
ncbi:MAG: DUF1801 domain-containing protein [Boseongicola sp.]|nr:DUF1801 domain-containing protein [Boseongicola sp.]MDD9979446.1 DUF1801 domain-containing protein [Boseongicola sp.]